MRRSGTWVVLATLIAVTLAASPATARESEHVQGTFEVAGTIRFDGPTSGSGAPLALLLNGTARAQVFLESPSVTFCAFEQRYVETSPVPVAEEAFRAGLPKDGACYPLHDVRLVSGGNDEDGWLALYPDEGSRVAFASGGADLESKLLSRIASYGAATASDPDTRSPEQRDYAAVVERPHLFGSASGRVAFDGGALLKLDGPDFEMSARENSTEWRTGSTRSTSPGTHELVMRWATLEFDRANLTIQTPSPITVALSSIDVDFERVSAVPMSGEMRSATRAYVAAGGVQSIGGRLSATLTPDEDLASRTAFSVRGEMTSTTLAGRAYVVDPPQDTAVVVAVAGVLLAIVAVVVATLLLRRRKRDGFEGLGSPDERAAREAALKANRAADQERWDEALDHIRAARLFQPRDPLFALEEATYLWQLSFTEEAVKAYEDAARLASAEDGEPDYWAGIRSAQLGNFALAEAHFERSLSRDPTIAHWLEGDPIVSPLLKRPTFRSLLVAARARSR